MEQEVVEAPLRTREVVLDPSPVQLIIDRMLDDFEQDRWAFRALVSVNGRRCAVGSAVLAAHDLGFAG